jgi:hypothetical protein
MDLKLKYGENYYLLAGLRDFVESGTMLASVNFWRDSIQGYQELNVVDNRANFVQSFNHFFFDDFVNQFFIEEFPAIEEKIGMSDASSIMTLIHDTEGATTYLLFKDCIISYAREIAKASKEDWLAFIGLTDNISDKEETFLYNLEVLLRGS